MERYNSAQLAAALAAGLLATISWLPHARAELVYEDEAAPAQAPAEAARVEDRGTLRQALGSAEKARVTHQAKKVEAAAPALEAEAPLLAAADADQPVVASRTGDSAEDVRNMNKSELMRRQRVREELRNEDVLQERLEELRLRDERRRTDQILGVSSGKKAKNAAEGDDISSVALPTPLYGGVQEQVINAPATERPGQGNVRAVPANTAPAPASATGVQLAGISAVTGSDQPGANQSSLNASVQESEKDEKTTLSITPRAGMGSMASKGGYDMHPRFAGGIGIGIATSENLSFEVGYTYAEYGVAIGSGNPFVQAFQNSQRIQGYQGNLDTLTMKQNVIDAGLKLHLLGTQSKIRPFIGGGAAYSKSYINYDQKILSAFNSNDPSSQGLRSDYELSSYLGYLSAGVDVRMSKSVSVGVIGKYYSVLSSSESGNLNNYGFYNPGAQSGYNSGPEKQYVGGSVANASFYNIMGGVSFTF